MFSYKVVLDFCDIHRKTAVKESFYIKAGGKEMQLDQKRDSVTGFLQLILQKSTCRGVFRTQSNEHLQCRLLAELVISAKKSSIVDIQLISQYASNL